jgi:hypothetical protein
MNTQQRKSRRPFLVFPVAFAVLGGICLLPVVVRYILWNDPSQYDVIDEPVAEVIGRLLIALLYAALISLPFDIRTLRTYWRDRKRGPALTKQER